MPILLNLTPHSLNIFNESGDEIFFAPPAARPARVIAERSVTVLQAGEANIPLHSVVNFGLRDLPSQRDNVFPVVSRAVAEVAHWREDLLTPWSLLRDITGQVIGCRGLYRYKSMH